MDVCHSSVKLFSVNCISSALSWTYNPRTGNCQKLLTGGCWAGKNLFESEFECLMHCAKGKSGKFFNHSTRLTVTHLEIKLYPQNQRLFVLNGQPPTLAVDSLHQEEIAELILIDSSIIQPLNNVSRSSTPVVEVIATTFSLQKIVTGLVKVYKPPTKY